MKAPLPSCQLGALIMGDGREWVSLSLARYDGDTKEWTFMHEMISFLPAFLSHSAFPIL
jgi:hypothetical protein